LFTFNFDHDVFGGLLVKPEILLYQLLFEDLGAVFAQQLFIGDRERCQILL